MNNPSDPHSSPASTSAVVDRYQQHCQSGPMPDLAGFVASVPALDPRDLAALVHVDQRHRHAAGAPLPAESYFESFPALRSDTELALDVVYQEYVLRRDAGEAYSTDKYLSRFPDLAEQLAMQFDLDGAMGDEHSSRSMPNMQATVEQPPAYPPGTVIGGRYKLLEEIGEGGMGTVWVAQQTEPVRRRVALKLIKPGMDSRQVLSRFEAERQALAVMDHPHIAKVLDGGMTDQGRPYFVMEYVKGEPITDYCDHARLSVQERLKLFVQVCQAVQHAHQKGIIHRDLKPSNILVCPYDGQPVPKVIDFGLAKAMHQPLTEHTLYTAHGVMVGTPLYMSPEQAQTNNLDIDTRSDLYSLGVVLYELITGSTPLEKRRLHDAALQEKLRLIKEEEPPKPSSRLSGSGSLPTIAAERHTEPAQLSRAVRGDLDWIVMKTLEKERSRRYETANGLARDIERYLHDDPVEARPPSAGYRFSKFARRNKAALLTVGLVAAALVVGSMVSTWQAIRATRAENLSEQRLGAETKARAGEQEQRKVAQARQAEAEANFEKAKAAVDKYFTLVSESTLLDVPGLQPLRKDLLEASLEFYLDAAQERSNDPAVLVDVALAHLRVGSIYFALARIDDFLDTTDRALDVIDRLRRDHPGAGHERKLAGWFKGERQTWIQTDGPRNPARAFQTGLRFLTTWEHLAVEHPAEAAWFQSDLMALQVMMASGLSGVGRHKEALEYLRKARAAGEKLVAQYPQVPLYRATLAEVCRDMTDSYYSVAADKADERMACARRSLELAEGLAAEFPAVPAYRDGLAQSLVTIGSQIAKTEPRQAEELNRRAMDLFESLVREFPSERAYWWSWRHRRKERAVFEASRGNDPQANQHVQMAIETFESQIKVRPQDRWLREELAHFCRQLADELSRQGTLRALAEQLDRRSDDLYEHIVTDDPKGSSPVAHSEVAGILLRRGKLSEALEQARIAASLNPTEWSIHGRLLEVLNKIGNPKQTLEVLKEYEALTKEYPSNPWYRMSVATALGVLVEQLVAAGQQAEADATRQRAAKMWESFLAENPQDRRQLAWALSDAAGRLQASPAVREPLLRRALALHTELANELSGNTSHLQQVGHLYRNLGWLVRGKGQLDESRQNFEKAVEVFKKLALDDIPQRDGFYRSFQADTLNQLGSVLGVQGRAEEAAATTRRSVDVYAALVSDFPDNRDYRAGITRSYANVIEVLLTQDKHAEAEAMIRQAIDTFDKLAAVHPAVPDYHRSRAVFQRKLAQRQAADKRALEAEKSYLLAIDSYEKIIAEFPQYEDLWRVYSGLAWALAASNQPLEAEEARRKMVELAPNNAQTLNYFAWDFATSASADSRSASLAVDLAKKGIELDPKNVQLPTTLGVAHYRAGNWQDAIEWLEKSMALRTGGDSFDWFFLAMAHWQLDHKDDARKWYDQSVEWMEKNQPKNEELVRFRAEAEELLGITQARPTSNVAPQVDDAEKPKK